MSTYRYKQVVYGLPARIVALTALFALLLWGLTGIFSDGVAFAGGLKDVGQHWAAAEIGKAISTGYVKGYPDGRFKPDAGVTRSEFIAMVDVAFQIPASQDRQAFKDVRGKDWFAQDLQSALAAGFVSGYPDGTFRPQKSVTRQEAACLLAKLLKLDGGGSTSFSDAGQIDSWAKSSIAELVAEGIMAGYPNGSFQPKKVISRAEAVVMINSARALASGPVSPADPAPPSTSSNPSARQGGASQGTLDVQVKQGSTGITIDIQGANGNCQWTEETSPQRLVVTVPGITSVRTPLEIDPGVGSLDKIVTLFPGTAAGTAEVDIFFESLPAPLAYSAALGNPGELLVTLPPQIYKIQAGAVSDFLAINMWGTAPLSYQATNLDGPTPQVAFDFAGFTLASSLQAWQQQLDLLGVKNIKLIQYQPDVVRLVAEGTLDISATSDASFGGCQIVLRLRKRPADPVPQAILAGKKVVLDAGHGGNDAGAIGPHGVEEKDVNLEITAKTAEILRQQGVDVTLTRSDDSYVDLSQRAAIANNINADVFVCIHANSTSDRAIGGTGTYTYAPAGTSLGQQRSQRLTLARDLQNETSASLGLHNRGVFEDNFEVLRCTVMPAALIEVAFISNPAEEKLLADANFQQQAASAIARGITKFLTGS
ncbi:MAG: N-acetylmuramoyl-L-alanine amidase [Thermacetogeniaceae bacterium]